MIPAGDALKEIRPELERMLSELPPRPDDAVLGFLLYHRRLTGILLDYLETCALERRRRLQFSPRQHAVMRAGLAQALRTTECDVVMQQALDMPREGEPRDGEYSKRKHMSVRELWAWLDYYVERHTWALAGRPIRTKPLRPFFWRRPTNDEHVQPHYQDAPWYVRTGAVPAKYQRLPSDPSALSSNVIYYVERPEPAEATQIAKDSAKYRRASK